MTATPLPRNRRVDKEGSAALRGGGGGDGGGGGGGGGGDEASLNRKKSGYERRTRSSLVGAGAVGPDTGFDTDTSLDADTGKRVGDVVESVEGNAHERRGQ